MLLLTSRCTACFVQAKLVEEGPRSHAQSTEEYYHAERDYTRAQHTVEEIEVRCVVSCLSTFTSLTIRLPFSAAADLLCCPTSWGCVHASAIKSAHLKDLHAWQLLAVTC